MYNPVVIKSIFLCSSELLGQSSRGGPPRQAPAPIGSLPTDDERNRGKQDAKKMYEQELKQQVRYCILYVSFFHI